VGVLRPGVLFVLVLAVLALPPPVLASGVAHRPVGGGATQDMLSSINASRGRRGLRPLRTSGALMRSAQGYSRNLMGRGILGHSRLALNGQFRRLGEALECHSGLSPRPAMALRLLLESPPHRRLLLSAQMREVGVGVARGRFRGTPSVIWVLHFGRT
jgi:uncharacterized protein YkwD